MDGLYNENLFLGIGLAIVCLVGLFGCYACSKKKCLLLSDGSQPILPRDHFQNTLPDEIPITKADLIAAEENRKQESNGG